MILSNGTVTVSTSGANSLSVRYAVVSVPGTAMRSFFTSSSVYGRCATIIGPYFSPTEPPHAISV